MSEATTDPFWAGLAAGEVRLPTCGTCAKTFFPPGPVCPHCQSARIEWTTDDGAGELVAFTRQHRTAPGVDAPIVVGIVSLTAGPRLLARIDAPHESLTVGNPVAIEPWEYDEGVDRGRLTEKPFFVAVPIH